MMEKEGGIEGRGKLARVGGTRVHDEITWFFSPSPCRVLGGVIENRKTAPVFRFLMTPEHQYRNPCVRIERVYDSPNLALRWSYSCVWVFSLLFLYRTCLLL